MSTILFLFLLFIFLCFFKLKITFRWTATTPGGAASPSRLEQGGSSPEEIGFRDPFGRKETEKERERERGEVPGGGMGRTIQDVVRGLYGGKEAGREIMLRGGSDRLGKGLGV